MRKRTLILALTAILLVCAATAGTAFAYFTTYARATGGYTIELGDQTTIDDDVSNWVKHVKIKVAEDSEPVFLRVKAFGPIGYPLEYSDGQTYATDDNDPVTQDELATWTPASDGYWYYSEPVAYYDEEDKDSTGKPVRVLDIRITNVPDQKDIIKAEDFNVVVVHETTPARYNADGTPVENTPEVWMNAKVDRGTDEGGMENE